MRARDCALKYRGLVQQPVVPLKGDSGSRRARGALQHWWQQPHAVRGEASAWVQWIRGTSAAGCPARRTLRTSPTGEPRAAARARCRGRARGPLRVAASTALAPRRVALPGPAHAAAVSRAQLAPLWQLLVLGDGSLTRALALLTGSATTVADARRGAAAGRLRGGAMAAPPEVAGTSRRRGCAGACGLGNERGERLAYAVSWWSAADYRAADALPASPHWYEPQHSAPRECAPRAGGRVAVSRAAATATGQKARAVARAPRGTPSCACRGDDDVAHGAFDDDVWGGTTA